LAKEQNSSKPSTTAKDAEFKISFSSEDIDKINEKIRNEDNYVQVQNNNIASGVILFNTCTNCDIKFIPKNSMTYETLCGPCVGKKQNETEMN
jgi:hypothetical protein